MASLGTGHLKVMRHLPKIPISSLCTKHTLSLCKEHKKLIYELPQISALSLSSEQKKPISALPTVFAVAHENVESLSSLIRESSLNVSCPVQRLNTSLTRGPPTNSRYLPTSSLYEYFKMPTSAPNRLKVYEDDTQAWKTIRDPSIQDKKIEDRPLPGLSEKKEAVRMIVIRRRKMRKHKLKKLRKRMKFVYARIKLKRALRKEQEFRTELLSQVEAADKFDAKEYVQRVLHTLRYHPRPETIEECRARFRELKKINRYNTNFIRPKFD